MAEEDASEKIPIVNYFIRNTHVGEITDVLNDLRKICGPELLEHEAVQEELATHYGSHCYQIDIGGV